MELVPGLFWIEGLASNVYLWRAEAGVIMVDTGMPGDAKKILAKMKEYRVAPQEVSAILLTHADIDHAGGAAELAARCKAPIYAGAATAALLARGKSPKHMPRVAQFVTDRFIGYKAVPGDKVRIVAEGQLFPELEEWQALATPGHCDDHFSYCSSIHGILFAGDALSTRGDSLGLNARFVTADQSQAAQSARRLLCLTPAVIACGHGRPLIDHDASAVMMVYRQLGELVA